MLLILTLRRSGSIDRDELMELILRQAEKQDATTMFKGRGRARNRALFFSTRTRRARARAHPRRPAAKSDAPRGLGQPARALGAPSDRVMALSCPSIHPSVNVTVFTSPSVDRGALHPRGSPPSPARAAAARHRAACRSVRGGARDGGGGGGTRERAARARARALAAVCVSGD